MAVSALLKTCVSSTDIDVMSNTGFSYSHRHLTVNLALSHELHLILEPIRHNRITMTVKSNLAEEFSRYPSPQVTFNNQALNGRKKTLWLNFGWKRSDGRGFWR
jgi:hypothetical protein